MIYLGEQLAALNEYSKDAICWLGVKIKGRQTAAKPTGYYCGNSLCLFCKSDAKIRSGIDQAFRDLFSEALIKELIVAKPQRLHQIWTELRSNYISIPGKNEDDFKKYGKKLFVISGYKKWFLKEKWNYKLAKRIDKHTCTYCNKEYIFVYKKPSGKGMVPQFDHWFPKADYPILALSFYNLIPSCATCNGIKSSIDMNVDQHLHPYVDKNISSSFKYSFLPISTNSNKIVFKNNLLSNKSIATIKALNLPMIYEGHSSKELQDLIDLRYKYSDNYLETLLEKTFGRLEISEQEKYRLVFGIELEEENYHKRIMSKFKKDIITELMNIK